MTGARNGAVSLWVNKKIENSAQHFNDWTLVLHKNDRIFAASKNKDVLELNMNLEIVKKFTGRDYQPYTIDANENYLAVGYSWYGYVDVHSRKELDRNGTQLKTMASNFVC